MKNKTKKLIIKILVNIPIIKFYFKIRFSYWMNRIKFARYLKFLVSINKEIYWDIDKRSCVSGIRGILLGVADSPGINVPGCYFQGSNGILFGGYNYIAPNVCIVSANHDEYNLLKHVKNKPILIGAYNWFGFGSVILPGVQIGDHVVIGANSVVTKDIPSFSIVAGNPAKIIRSVDENKVGKFYHTYEHYGFIEKDSKRGRSIQKKRIQVLSDYSRKYGSILSETLQKELSENTTSID